MKMKKCNKTIISLILVLIMTVALALPVFAAGDGVSVYLDGEKMQFDVEPIIVDGRTMVPMRAVLEKLGAEVFWDPATRAAMAKKGDIEVGFTIDDKTMLKLDFSEEKVRAMYDTFSESSGLWMQAQHILILRTEDGTALKTAKDILAQVKKDPSKFEELMLTYGEDPGVADEPTGYIFKEGDMVDEFYKGALKLKEGEISDIVETTYGYHIIKKVKHWENGIPFEDVRTQVEQIYVYNNIEAIQLDVPAQLIGGRTLVPVRAIAEAFGCDVKWDPATRTANIYSKK